MLGSARRAEVDPVDVAPPRGRPSGYAHRSGQSVCQAVGITFACSRVLSAKAANSSLSGAARYAGTPLAAEPWERGSRLAAVLPFGGAIAV